MDFYTDTNKHELINILKTLKKNGIEPPDYVWKKVADDKDINDLPLNSFADQKNKQYPIHTKADTWLSAAYLGKESNISANAKDRFKGMIHKGARLWDINPETLSQMDKILGPKLAKQASEDETIIESESDFIDYCEKSINKFKDMEMSVRHDLSNKLLKTAEDQDWHITKNLKKQLEKTAGKGTCHKKDGVRYLYKLQSEIPSSLENFHNILETCMKDFENRDTNYIDSDTLYKTAALVDMIYRGRSLNKQGMSLPENNLFTISASDMNQVQKEMVKLPGGKVISKTVIKDNAPKLKSNLGAVTGEDITDFDSIIEKMKSMTPVMVNKILDTVDDDFIRMGTSDNNIKEDLEKAFKEDPEKETNKENEEDKEDRK